MRLAKIMLHYVKIVMIFFKKYRKAWKHSRDNGWLDDYYWLDRPKVQFKVKKGYWTYERCFNAAKQCSCRSEFQRKFNSAYCKSLQMGWIKEFFPTKESQTKVTAINMSTNETSTFDSIFECAKTLNILRQAISRVICGKRKNYTWLHI